MAEEDPMKGKASESGRRLAAIVFADVEGYTELSSRDEDMALEVIRAFQRIAREGVGDQKGRIVKFLGDGMLAEFQSLDAAVGASHALQEAFGELGEAIEAGVALRIGVHLGDVMFSEDGDVHGSGVNVASRIEGYAPPSGIVVSDSAYHHLRHRKAYTFTSIGVHDLKGVPDPMELYVVRRQGEPGSPPDLPMTGRRGRRAGGAPATSPGRSRRVALAAVAVVVTLLGASYAADLPGIRARALRIASAVGLASEEARTSAMPPRYTVIDGGAVVDRPVTLSFTAPIDPATATVSSIQLLGPDDLPVPARISATSDGRSVEIAPLQPLRYDASHRIVINTLLRAADGTAVELPEGDTSLEERLAFRTQPTPEGAPALTESSPSDAADDVGGNVEPTFVFDQALDPASVSEVTVRLVDDAERPVESTIVCCGEEGDRIAVMPAAPLRAGRYQVHLGRGLSDTDGEYLPDQTITFAVSETTVAAAAPPPSGPGRLAIRVTPAEVSSRTIVYLNGESLGAAPIAARTVPERVRHHIEIVATDEYARNRLSIYEEEVTLRPGERRTLEAAVTPFGTVSVTSSPAGVVYIDGQEVGPTPLVAHLVTAGRSHRLEIRPTPSDAATHRPYTAEFTVDRLETQGLGRIQLPERRRPPRTAAQAVAGPPSHSR
ncbi:MAG: Ig-like domain-containing protein [Longimicrobiales bacterium]|nr:Ig-like domain-containing protein [Longimicrobiales bacterium]